MIKFKKELINNKSIDNNHIIKFLANIILIIPAKKIVFAIII